jgi:hypothetical protein
LADNNVIITFQFQTEGQSGVLSAVDAINERIKQGQQAQQAQPFNIANVSPGGASEPWRPPSLSPAHAAVSHEATTEERHVHVEASASGHKEIEELGKGAEIANKSFEVLKRGVEGVGQAMISGSLQASIVGFQRFSSSVEEAGSVVGGFLGKLGLVGAVGSAVAGSIGGLAVLFNELASRMSENVLEFNELGKAAGLDNQQFANLEGAFARSGVGLEQLHQVVRVTTNRLQGEWGDIVRTVRDSADHYAEGTIKINESHRKLTDSADLPVEAEMKIAKSRREVVDSADKSVEAEMKIAKSRRDVADSSDLTTQAEMRIARAEREEVDAVTLPKQAERKIESAELGARSAEDAVPGAERTKQQTEFDLTKAQLQFRAKYLGEPITPEDNQRLQLLQRQADASHIEALKAQEKEDGRNIERAKMHRDEAEETEQKTRRNAVPEAQEGQERVREAARKEERNAIPEALEGQQQARLDAARIARDAIPEAREAQEQARIDAAKNERNAMPEAKEAQERAALELRATQRAQTDAMQKDPARLAEAIRGGGGGVNWREIAAPDIFRSLAFMGGGTMMGTLSAAHQFVTMPAMQGQTEANQGVAGAVAQQFGLRGGIGPILDALTKGEFNKLTPETEKTSKDMGEENLKSAEGIRDSLVKMGQDIRSSVIETVKNSHLDTFAVKSAEGMGAVISSIPDKAKAAFDGAAASADALSTALNTAAISVDKAFSPGVRQAISEDKPLQDLYAKLPALQQQREDITGEMRAKGLTPGAVLTEPQQKQADVLQSRLDAVVGQIREINQSAKPLEERDVKQQGGDLFNQQSGPELKGAAEDLKNAAIKGSEDGSYLKDAAGQLKEAAQALKSAGGSATGERHSSGGYITGPGTGTSDSIRAPWLSNGEYVVKAARVAQVGKDKLDDLNAGRVGFADGGLVDAGHGDCPDPEMSPRTMAYIKGRPSYAEGDVQPSSGILPDAKIFEHPPAAPSTMVPQDAVNLWDHPHHKTDSFADGGYVQRKGFAEGGVVDLGELAAEIVKSPDEFIAKIAEARKFSLSSDAGKVPENADEALLTILSPKAAAEVHALMPMHPASAGGSTGGIHASVPAPLAEGQPIGTSSEASAPAAPPSVAATPPTVTQPSHPSSIGNGTGVGGINWASNFGRVPEGWEHKIALAPGVKSWWDSTVDQHPGPKGPINWASNDRRVPEGWEKKIALAPGVKSWWDKSPNPHTSDGFINWASNGGEPPSAKFPEGKINFATNAGRVPEGWEDRIALAPGVRSWWDDATGRGGSGASTDQGKASHGIDSHPNVRLGSRDSILPQGFDYWSDDRKNTWYSKNNLEAPWFDSAEYAHHNKSLPFSPKEQAQFAKAYKGDEGQNFAPLTWKKASPVFFEGKWHEGTLPEVGKLTSPVSFEGKWLSKVPGMGEPSGEPGQRQPQHDFYSHLELLPPTPPPTPPPSFAEGGLIQGPGTGTSDSISAPWVSNGEYVIKADRVAQVGVDNMHAFNEGRLGFAGGGMVSYFGETTEEAGTAAGLNHHLGRTTEEAGFAAGGSVSIPSYLSGGQIMGENAAAASGMMVSPWSSPPPPSGGVMMQAVGQIGQERSAFSSGMMLGDNSPLLASNLVGSSSNSPSFAGHYALDVTTDKGIVPAMMTEDMMSSLSQSSLASKLTRTGITPSWGS